MTHPSARTFLADRDTRPPERAARWWKALHMLEDLRHDRNRQARDLARLDREIAAKEIELTALVLKD